MLARKAAIKGLRSKIVEILEAPSFENLVWIETKHDYSVICQTRNGGNSNKKDLEGHVLKKYKDGRLELGRFKNKQEWKDGILDNWIGGVLKICEDEITFSQFNENGNKASEDLIFNQIEQEWKKHESE